MTHPLFKVKTPEEVDRMTVAGRSRYLTQLAQYNLEQQAAAAKPARKKAKKARARR